MPPSSLRGGLQRALDGRGVADVGLEGEAAELAARPPPRVALHVEDRDARALRREPPAGREADARGAARHDRAAPLEEPRHWKTCPPFTSSDCPVITRERSEAKKTTAGAISSEVGRWRSAVLRGDLVVDLLRRDAALLGLIAEVPLERRAPDVAGHDGVHADLAAGRARARDPASRPSAPPSRPRSRPSSAARRGSPSS